MHITVERNQYLEIRKIFPEQKADRIFSFYTFIRGESAENTYDGMVPREYLKKEFSDSEDLITDLISIGYIEDRGLYIFITDYEIINKYCTKKAKAKNLEKMRNQRLNKASKTSAKNRKNNAEQMESVKDLDATRGAYESLHEDPKEVEDRLLDGKYDFNGKNICILLRSAARDRNRYFKDNSIPDHIDEKQFCSEMALKKARALAKQLKVKYKVAHIKFFISWISDLRSGAIKFADRELAMLNIDWFDGYLEKKGLI